MDDRVIARGVAMVASCLNYYFLWGRWEAMRRMEVLHVLQDLN
jgi:cytochrome c-type biogenesis protein CcmH/NrfG